MSMLVIAILLFFALAFGLWLLDLIAAEIERCLNRHNRPRIRW